MGWYDGTHSMNFNEFIQDKTKITNNLFIDKQKNRLLFINDLKEDSPLMSFTDPHAENHDYTYVFYSFFFDKEQKELKEVITEFDKKEIIDDTPIISLYRKEEDKFFWYGYGRIVSHLLYEQEKLKAMLPNTIDTDNVFIVPLNMYYFECPVCHNRTLHERGMWEICYKCWWEDEGGGIGGANGHIKPTKELLEKYPDLYDEYVWFYKYKHNIPDDEDFTPDLENLDESINVPITVEVYRDFYINDKEDIS